MTDFACNEASTLKEEPCNDAHHAEVLCLNWALLLRQENCLFLACKAQNCTEHKEWLSPWHLSRCSWGRVACLFPSPHIGHNNNFCALSFCSNIVFVHTEYIYVREHGHQACWHWYSHRQSFSPQSFTEYVGESTNNKTSCWLNYMT